MISPFQDLYDLIPKIECKGHCGANKHTTCCGPIGCGVIESEILDRYDGIRSPWIAVDDASMMMDPRKLEHHLCPHLGHNGRCTAYEVRPFVCRMWGVVTMMPCPWGCKPERWWNNDDVMKWIGRFRERHDELMRDRQSKREPELFLPDPEDLKGIIGT